MHLVFHTLSLTVTTVSSINFISCTNNRICEITVEKRVNRNFPSSYSGVNVTLLISVHFHVLVVFLHLMQSVPEYTWMTLSSGLFLFVDLCLGTIRSFHSNQTNCTLGSRVLWSRSLMWKPPYTPTEAYESFEWMDFLKTHKNKLWQLHFRWLMNLFLYFYRPSVELQ